MKESVKELVKNRYYPIEFRLSLVKEYLCGGGSFRYLSQKYAIDPYGHTLKSWVSKYATSEMQSRMSKEMKKVLPSTMKTDKEKSLERRLRLLEEELSTTKQDLKHEKIKSAALDFMIDVAEQQLKIQIRKKPGAKQ